MHDRHSMSCYGCCARKNAAAAAAATTTTGIRRSRMMNTSSSLLMMLMISLLVVLLTSSPLSLFPSVVEVQAFSTTITTASLHHHHHHHTSLGGQQQQRRRHGIIIQSVVVQRATTSLQEQEPDKQQPLLFSTTRLYAQPSKQQQQQQDDDDSHEAAYSGNDAKTKSSSIILQDEEEEQAVVYATGLTVAAWIVAWSMLVAHASPFVTLFLSLAGGAAAAGYGSTKNSTTGSNNFGGLLNFMLRAIGTVSLQGVVLFQERVVVGGSALLWQEMSTQSSSATTTRVENDNDVIVVVQQQPLSSSSLEQQEEEKVESMSRDRDEPKSNDDVVVIVDDEPRPLSLSLDLYIEEQVESSSSSSSSRVVPTDANTIMGAVLLGAAAATELVEQKDQKSTIHRDDEQKINVVAVDQPLSSSSLELEQQQQPQEEEKQVVESMSTSSRVPDATILGAAVTTSLVAMAVSNANIFVSTVMGVAAAYASVLPSSNTAGPVGNAMRTVGEFAVSTYSFGTEWADRVTQALDAQSQWEEYQEQQTQQEQQQDKSSGAATTAEKAADTILSFLSDVSLTMTSALHSLKESFDSTTVAAPFQKNENDNKVVRAAAGPSFFIDELSVDKDVADVVKMSVSKTAATSPVVAPRQSVTTVKTTAASTTTTAASAAVPARMPLFFAVKQQQQQEQDNTAAKTENAAVPSVVAAMVESTKETFVVESSKALKAKKSVTKNNESNSVTTTAATTTTRAVVAKDGKTKSSMDSSSSQEEELTRRALLAYRLALQAREQNPRGVETQSAAAAAVEQTPAVATKAPVVKQQVSSSSPTTVSKENDGSAKVKGPPATKQKQENLDKQKDEVTRRALLTYRLTLQAIEQKQRVGAKTQSTVENKSNVPVAPAAKAQVVVTQTFSPSTVAKKENDYINAKSTDRAAASEKQNEMNRRALLAYRLTLQAMEQKQRVGAKTQSTVENKSNVPVAPAAKAQVVVVTQTFSPSTVAKKENDYINAKSTDRTVASEKQNELNRRALLAYRLTLQAIEQKQRTKTQVAVEKSSKIPTSPESFAAATTTTPNLPRNWAEAKAWSSESLATTPTVTSVRSNLPRNWALLQDVVTKTTAAAEKQNEMNQRALLAYRLTLQANAQKQRAMTVQAVNKSKKVATAPAAKAQAVDRVATVKLEETVMVESDVVVVAAAATAPPPPPPQDTNGAFKIEVANGKSTEKEESTAPTESATKQAQVVVKQVPSPMAAAKLQEISAILESARDTGSAVPASMQLEVVNAILTEFPEEAGTVSPETTKLDQINAIILEVRNKAGPADTGAAAAEAQLEEINAILATTRASTAGASPKVKGQKSKKSSKSPSKKKKTTMSMSTE